MRKHLSHPQAAALWIFMLIIQSCQSGCPIEITSIRYEQERPLYPGIEIPLVAELSNPNDCPVEITWTINSGELQSNGAPTSKTLLTDCEPQTYQIRVEALDEDGKLIAAQNQSITIDNLPSLDVIEEYISSGFYGDFANIKLEKVHFRGRDADKYTYNPYGPEQYAGVYYQYPENNWGDTLGKDLSGYNLLTFFACSPDRATVNFIAGGVSDSQMPYKDSFKGITGFLDLGPEWVQYEIDLTNRDLSRVIGGFAWVSNRESTPQPSSFYIADIEYSRVNCPD